MQKNILEHIIRKVLSEQGGTYVLDLKVPTAKDDQYMDKRIVNILKKSEKRNVERYGVIRFEVVRRGGRQEIDGTKKAEYGENEVKRDFISNLNRYTSGLLGQRTTENYIWFISIDPYNEQTNKQEKIRAKYVVLAAYVNKDLFYKIPEKNTGTGWTAKLTRGAQIYELADINETEWRFTRGKSSAPDKDEITQSAETVENIDDLPAASNNIKFGSKYSTNIVKLYGYFSKNEIIANLDRDDRVNIGFGCELDALIRQFQEENGIPVTGVWDSETRIKALKLKELEYNIKNTTALTDKYDSCKLTNLDLSNITYPTGGSFTQENTKTTDIEFVKVQQIMYDYLVKQSKNPNFKGLLARQEIISFKQKLDSKNGIYDDDTKFVVGVINKLTNRDNKNYNIDSQFIKNIQG